MIRKEDILWKGIIEEIFVDFIHFIHPGIDRLLDFSKGYTFLDKELEQVFPPENEEFKSRYVDKLVKMYTLQGAEEWVLLHIEVQGQYTADFGQRMFTYFYRIFDKYGKRISAYAIFTEASTIMRTNVFKLEFLGTKLSYQFNTYKISNQRTEDLLASNNPFAIVVLAARTALSARTIQSSDEHDSFLINLKFELVKQLYAKNFPRQKIRSVLKFIKNHVRFENKENNGTFEIKLQELKPIRETMGIEEQIRELIRDDAKEEGLEEGLAKGLAESKLKLQSIARNITLNLGYTQKQTAQMLQISVKFVREACRQSSLPMDEA